MIVVLLAAAKLGAVLVPVNPGLGLREFKYQLRHAEVTVAVTMAHPGDLDYVNLLDELMSDLPDLRCLVMVGDEESWYDDRVCRMATCSHEAVVDRSIPTISNLSHSAGPAVTSGTVGKPKGVVLTHYSFVHTALLVAEPLSLTEADQCSLAYRSSYLRSSRRHNGVDDRGNAGAARSF